MPNLPEIDQESKVNLVERVFRKYEEGGGRAIISAVKGRFKRWLAPSALYWSKLGSLSTFLAYQIKTQNPPILVLSLPRSGSSWVGITLGSAANALYLKEPLTVSHLMTYGPASEVVFEVDPLSPPEVYRQSAYAAFSGIPAFPSRIVIYPSQWRFLGRGHRHLVIKEVNPMAGPWLLQQYHPRLVFLVRHPAAVAFSYKKKGWISGPVGTKFGEQQGYGLRKVLDSLRNYDDYRVVLYEELCVRPMEIFRDLFNFADLTWDNNIEVLIQDRTSRNVEVSGTTHRVSYNMVRSWKGQLRKEELENLRTGYECYGLPWYASAEDWD